MNSTQVRLVFENATAYNPPRNAVHAAAVAMSRDFDADLERALERCARQSQATHDHECGLCAGKQCVLCGDKCLTFEAPALICSGPCGQRVRRDQHYHVTRDGSRLWCHKCYLGLKSVIPPPADHGEPAAVPKPNLQPDFNMSVCFDAPSSAVLRELDESHRFVQTSAESTSN